MHRVCGSAFLRDHIFGDFLLRGVTGAVGSDRGDGGSAVDVLLVSVVGVIVEGFDNIIGVDLGGI